MQWYLSLIWILVITFTMYLLLYNISAVFIIYVTTLESMDAFITGALSLIYTPKILMQTFSLVMLRFRHFFIQMLHLIVHKNTCTLKQ